MIEACLLSHRFSGVDFADTVFARANCASAVFVDVDLRRADFREAQLDNALFLNCDFEGAEFTGASVKRTRFIACSGLGPETIRRLRQEGAHLLLQDSRSGGGRVSAR
jgi:uncharacterized protein YjbI with pentapeptide repeats